MDAVTHTKHDNVRGIFYSSGHRVLKVIYPNGTYEYSNVSPEFVDEIRQSSNVAKTLVALRDASTYPCTKVA